MSKQSMPSKAPVIVLDDDDTDDGDSSKNQDVLIIDDGAATGANHADAAVVQSLMSIMNLKDAQQAQQLLAQFDNDLQRTISHLLDNTQKNNTNVKKAKQQQKKQLAGIFTTKTKAAATRGSLFSAESKAKNQKTKQRELAGIFTTKIKTKAATTSSPAKRSLFSSKPQQQSKKKRKLATLFSQNAGSSNSNDDEDKSFATKEVDDVSDNKAGCTDADEDSRHLSSQWHACYQKITTQQQQQQPSSRNDYYFVDPDFAPVRSSLDGRRTCSRAESKDSSYTAVFCRCGLPAAPKVVQRDGPNYGRFYLSCGQDRPGMRKRRARVVVQSAKMAATTTTTTTTTTTSPAETSKNTFEATTSTTTIQQSNDISQNNGRRLIVNPYLKKPTPPQSPATTTKDPSPSEQPSPSPSPPQRTRCDFFQWDADGSRGAAAATTADGYGTSRYSLLAWQHFGAEHAHCSLFGEEQQQQRTSTPLSSQIRQGAVGNCWFLSALTVVAEKPYLIQNIVPHTKLNVAGCYQINLCLDGQWTPVLVDSNLPVVVDDDDDDNMTNGNKKKKTLQKKRSPSAQQSYLVRGGVPFSMLDDEDDDDIESSPFLKRKRTKSSNNLMMAYPAFCAAPHGVLWGALVEKAYAKAHGCYAQLSGGFIAEGLQDLTGAPTETIVLSVYAVDATAVGTVRNNSSSTLLDALWERLRVFHERGFIMGVATAAGGDGLVGGHAYKLE